jgi:hypothetical protein
VPKWTVMIFMGADGVEGNKVLGEEADADIAELKSLPASGDLAVFVERHGDGKSERFRIDGGAQPEVAALDADPAAFANGIALTHFIDWALLASGHQRGDYSMLVLWGHAYQFALGHTQTQAGLDALDFAELASVLARFQEQKRQQWNAPSPPKLDIVAFDACSIATLEMARQLAPYTKYLLASQIGVPLPGWPYHRILRRLAEPFGRIMGPAEFGSYAVRRYCEHYRALERTVSLSHLDLRCAREHTRLADTLAGKLAIAMDDDAQEQQLVARLFEFAQTAENEPFVDVIALCRFLARYSGSRDVRAAARALGDALLSPKSVQPGQSVTGTTKPFIVEHGSNSSDGAGLHGVSLYAPHVADGHDFGKSSHFYEKLVFARETLWRDLVRALALPDGVCC